MYGDSGELVLHKLGDSKIVLFLAARLLGLVSCGKRLLWSCHLTGEEAGSGGRHLCWVSYWVPHLPAWGLEVQCGCTPQCPQGYVGPSRF